MGGFHGYLRTFIEFLGNYFAKMSETEKTTEGKKQKEIEIL